MGRPGEPRDYKREAAMESEQRKKERAMRNKARRQLEKEGLVHKGDGKDVDHKKSLDSGGSNARSNLRVRDAEANRGWRKGQSGYKA